MTLAPLSKPVEAEIKVASRDVGFVREGDPVRLKVDAFNYSEHGFAEGHVRSISEGAFTVDDNGQAVSPFYKARVVIDRMKFVDVPKNLRLIPGMTLAGDVKVGRRSLFRYVVGGFVRGVGESMREP